MLTLQWLSVLPAHTAARRRKSSDAATRQVHEWLFSASDLARMCGAFQFQMKFSEYRSVQNAQKHVWVKRVMGMFRRFSILIPACGEPYYLALVRSS